jgi:hypothetical protein
MAVSIQNPGKCEVPAVIRFLHAKEELLLKFIANLFLFMAKML